MEQNIDTKLQSKIKNVFLLDENMDLNLLINQFEDKNSSLIVALDNKTREKLDNLGLKYILREELFDKSDFDKINSETLHISTNWYKQESISKLLTIEGINLGWILELEFYFYLLHTITIFSCFKKIQNNFNPDTIVVSENFAPLAKTIFMNSDISIISNLQKTIQKFRTDFFPIKIKLGPFQISFRIKRNHFFTIKKIYEKIFLSSYNFLYSRSFNKKSILLVDFNPVAYEIFLDEIKKKNLDISFLNRRKPAIWNNRSFNIVKKNKSHVFRYEQYLDKESKNKIKVNYSQIQTSLSKLEKSDLLSEIFSIQESSFWEYTKNDFFKFCSTRFQEASFDITGAKKLLEQTRPSMILHHFGSSLQEKIIIFEARKLGISSYVISHGADNISLPIWPSIDKLIGILPIFEGTNVIVWGQPMKKFVLDHGVLEKNIITSGSIKHDKFHQLPKTKLFGRGSIVLALSYIGPINVEGQKLEVYKNYEESLIHICKMLKKIKNKEKILKLKPGEKKFLTTDVEPIVKKIDPSIQIIYEIPVEELLISCDVMITNQSSTIIQEANIFNVPVITLLADPQFSSAIFDVGYTKLFSITQKTEFNEYFKLISEDKKTRDKHIEKGKDYVKQYLDNHGQASKYLVKTLFEREFKEKI